MAEKATVGGVPVECLTGEPAAIWFGWRTLGNRELVREASAKGTHINLAHKCLAYRQNCSIEDAQHYFNKEVEIWITELLQKRQIYRASHILQNMKKNPIEYIFEVCIKTKDSLLRNFLSEYLINAAHFECQYLDSWNIIKNIIQFEQKYMIQDGLGSSLCIENIIKLPDTIKQALCTELYFSITDQSLLKNITNTVLWDYLLSNNKIEMIKFWIDVYYNGTTLEESNDINEEYKSLFTAMNITPDMIECIDFSSASNLIKNLIKNHLCRYGILVQKEKEAVKLILRRIFNSAMTLSEFNKALLHKASNVKKTEFLQSIDKELCLAHCVNETCTQEEKTKITELFDVVTEMCISQEQHQDMLIEGILKTVNYLSNDTNEYLKQNYLVVLVLIFSYLSNKNIISNQHEDSEIRRNTLKNIFTSKDDLQLGTYNISNEVLQSTLTQIPILKHIIENKPKQEITMYELLDGYKNLNVKQLFKWRFNNEPMPHFSDEILIQKYGYNDTLTYEYYLKEARPNMAILSLKQSQGNLSISSRRKRKASLYAHILALQNLNKPEILCSCISFIEMLGINSESLKLHITAANYVQKEIGISIGTLLENVIYKDEDDCKTVMSYIEDSFQKNLNKNLMEDSQQFINMLKVWDVVLRFSRAHNTSLPTSLLKFLANQNYWFEFVLICHIFTYPLHQVLENAKCFEDSIIREHLLTCLNNTQLTKPQSAICSEQKIKSRDVRQFLYTKIGVTKNDSPISSDSASISDSCSISDYPISDTTCSLDDDLWLIILKCHQSPDPPGALISASQLTLRPFLTVLATCYEPSSTAVYSYSWMVISTANEDILSEYKGCLEQQEWTANQVFNLLEKMVTCGYINTLSRAYKIFMPESPFNSFFEFLTQCVNHGDFKECQQNLLEFKTQCLNLKCNKVMDWDSSDITYLNNSYWVALVAIKCIIATLSYNLRSTHLQIKFLEILVRCNFHMDMPVQVPHFQRVLQIIKILQKTDVTLNFAAYTISDNVYNFDSEIQRCINELVRTEDYNSALELSSVAELNSSDIILAQYRNKFKYYMQKNDKIENAFWTECALNFKKCNVSPEKAVEFFIEHTEKVHSDKERYEILRLAFETLKNIETEQQTIDTLEMAMWKFCILAGPENIQLVDEPCIFNKLKTELLSGLSKVKLSCTLNDSYERSAAEKLINKLIDVGKLDIALRISTIFNYKHKDLQTLMLCLSLAEGEITPNELPSEQKSLLMETNKNKQHKYGALKNRGLQRLSSSSSLSTLTNIDEISKTKNDIHKVHMECLSLLQKFLETLEHGVDICLRIVLCYKLAIQLGKNYQFLFLLNNPYQFLQEIAEINIENKSEVLSDIITAYKIGDDTVAEFLAENITLIITRSIEGGYEDICLWGYPLNTNFRVIMELCNDVPLLGWQLLKTATKLLGHSYGEKRNVSAVKIIVELVIRAHDCFTTSCHMEGIASVLRKCQNLANLLQKHKSWTLLVRLVTGVGRFMEMNYIFQILKENDQFESLLGKGLDKWHYIFDCIMKLHLCGRMKQRIS
ncbi:spatacsin isoform X2 [Calliopsis andreniformis]|uniref:spatacsin isoform X2 n=1 Tax=Calliopsis andreniformis TaxID=337506 RepID=UPI003FCE1769